MIPRNFASAKNLEKRKKAFNDLRMTSHWPNKPKLFTKFPRTYGKPLKSIKNITDEDVRQYINTDGIKLI
jgi:hypothetical protein